MYNVVEIALGSLGNGAATISDKHNSRWNTSYHEKHILSPSEYRYFWISWANSTVRVGKGNTANQQEFMDWPHLTFDINYISIGTVYDTDGYWKFTIKANTTTSTPVTDSMTTKSQCSTVVTRSSISQASNTQSSTTATILSSTVESNNLKNEKQAKSLVSVYISVTSVVVIIIIIGVIIVFILRKRKRNIKRQESAVYRGNESKIDRKPISIVVNREYDYHSLEKENHHGYSNDSNENKNPDSHYIDLSLKEEPLTEARKYDYSTVNKTAKNIDVDGHDPEHDEFNYTKVNPRAKGHVEDNYGYNHLNTNRQQKKTPQNYSTMAMGTNGQKTDSTDTMYSHIENRGTKGHTPDVEAENNTYNKLNVRRNQNELLEENETAVYDHAGTEVQYPDINNTDDYSHLN